MMGKERWVWFAGLVLIIVIGIFFPPEAKSETVIGMIGPMTGEGAQAGTNMRDAVTLGIDEINARGGIKGEKLKLSSSMMKETPPNRSTAITALSITKRRLW